MGVFKFRSTDIGQNPSRDDIVKTIKDGINGSYGRTMPAFDTLSEPDLIALSEVVRVAADINAYDEPMQITDRPIEADLERGAELYKEFGCVDCHGESGTGNGILSETLSDNHGLPIKPSDLSVGQFKGGNEPEDIWARIYTGIAGTSMPAFGTTASHEDLWAVTEYVLSFSGQGR